MHFTLFLAYFTYFFIGFSLIFRCGSTAGIHRQAGVAGRQTVSRVAILYNRPQIVQCIALIKARGGSAVVIMVKFPRHDVPSKTIDFPRRAHNFLG